MKKRIAIIFIGTSVYLKYFKRFHATVTERFAVEAYQGESGGTAGDLKSAVIEQYVIATGAWEQIERRH